MYKVTVCSDNCENIIYANEGDLLFNVLAEGNILLEHPCGGKGICEKCMVLVNGETVLSCRYEIKSNINVVIPSSSTIRTAATSDENGLISKNMCLCLDIGTTTLVLALVSTDHKQIVKTVTHNNPQRAFGADIMSRIDYATKNGTEKLQGVLSEEITCMIKELFDHTCINHVDTLYVAGNTTMLHIFFGVPCHSLGYAPYTPVFLHSKAVSGKSLGFPTIDTIKSLDCISAFVGADLTSGLLYVKEPGNKKYNLLVDLGTNAEIVLYSQQKLYSTAAAAGPCFEGVNISCGMCATDGAIYSYTQSECLVIGDIPPRGICATGLIDTIALLLHHKIIDSTGFMEDGGYCIASDVFITQKDIRQFQLAKSAIYSGIVCLLKKAKVPFDDIETVYISGGFSSRLNIDNALNVGLLPKDFKHKIKAVNNSCLLGLVNYSCNNPRTPAFLKNPEYIDLASDEYFQELFIEKMMF